MGTQTIYVTRYQDSKQTKKQLANLKKKWQQDKQKLEKEKKERQKDKQKLEKEKKDHYDALLTQHTNQNNVKLSNLQQSMQLKQKKMLDQFNKQRQASKKQFQERQKKMIQAQQQLQSQIKLMQDQSKSVIKQLQEQLKELKDPQKIKQHVTKMKQLFWNELKNQRFETHNGKSVIFVGRTSVGKSSLLNTLFKTKVPTSKMSCTKQISIVLTYGTLQQNNLVSIFDCPGLDEHFDLIKDPYKIPKFMGCMSDIYYLYDGIIQSDIINTFMAMNKKIYLVRTKCDPDQDPEENQEVLAHDYRQITSLGCQTQIFLTSKKGGVDNAKLLEHIITPNANA